MGYREALNNTMNITNKEVKDDVRRKKRKGPTLYDFQLFDKERLEQIFNKESTLEDMKMDQINRVKELRARAEELPEQEKEQAIEQAQEIENQLGNYDLPQDEQRERDKLLSEGFSDWTRKDFK